MNRRNFLKTVGTVVAVTALGESLHAKESLSYGEFNINDLNKHELNHIVVTKSKEANKLYINGEFKCNVKDYKETIKKIEAHTWIRSSNLISNENTYSIWIEPIDNEYVPASATNIRIYDRRLSKKDIDALYGYELGSFGTLNPLEGIVKYGNK